MWGEAACRAGALAVAAVMWLTSGMAIAGDVYLPGGIGLDRPGEAIFADIECAATMPAALYGCGTGGDATPLRSVEDFGKKLSAPDGVPTLGSGPSVLPGR